VTLKLWTAPTPNGWKVAIMLEELAEAGVALPELEVRTIDLGAGEQFSDEFSAHNPTGPPPATRLD
jgi:GST-like protein